MNLKKFALNVLAFIIVGSIIGYYINWKNKEVLKSNTKIVYGVLIEEFKSGYSGKSWVYQYEVNNSEYTLLVHENTNNLKIGDSTLIEYSISEPSISQLVKSD